MEISSPKTFLSASLISPEMLGSSLLLKVADFGSAQVCEHNRKQATYRSQPLTVHFTVLSP